VGNSVTLLLRGKQHGRF